MGNRSGRLLGGDPSVDKIACYELFNLLADVRASIVLIDCRQAHSYAHSHLDGAVHAADDCAAEIRNHPRVERWDVVLYGDGSSNAASNQALTSELGVNAREALKQLAPFQSKCKIRVLRGGFDEFRKLYSFVVTGESGYEPSRLYPSEIMSRLYLSSHALAYDPVVLLNLRVTHVVNVTPDHPNCPRIKERPPIRYHRIPIVDDAKENVREYLSDAVAFISDAIQSGGVVLVHCRHGQCNDRRCMADGEIQHDARRGARTHEGVPPEGLAERWFPGFVGGMGPRPRRAGVVQFGLGRESQPDASVGG